MKGNSVTKGNRGEPILEIYDSHEVIKPKVRWNMHLNH